MTIEDLKETAAMAHLNMDDKELAAMFPLFEKMLVLLAPMRDAEKDHEAFPNGLAPASPTVLTGVFGNSRTVNSGFYRSANSANPADGNPDPDLNETMLNNAGERDGRFVVVPNVL